MALVILSTILLYCSIFHVGDFEEFYKIYIGMFYLFFSKWNSIITSIFSLNILQCLDQTAIFTFFGSNFWSQVQSNLGEHSFKSISPWEALLTSEKNLPICVVG